MCLTVLLFQENKSFGASYHLHSSSDVREVVLSTIVCTNLPFAKEGNSLEDDEEEEQDDVDEDEDALLLVVTTQVCPGAHSL